MSAEGNGRGVPLASGMAAGAAARPRIEAQQRRQLLAITVAAIVIFLALRLLPTGTNLSHMDFRVDPKAGNVIEFCDPLNPQFIPVVAARSPVTMSISTAEPAVAGGEVRAVVTLKTGSGKPVTPADLVVTHTRPLHLLVVDPSLADYQHVHPQPGPGEGQWAFSFSPRFGGAYRVFGDFTPAATGRGLYASADLNVAEGSDGLSLSAPRGRRELGAVNGASVERGGIVFALTAAKDPIRPGEPIELRFAMSRRDGGTVALEPVMEAFAHLVAFDEARSGFAHLHPAEADLLKVPDPVHPVLNFKLTIPATGEYVVWAQLKVSGRETFVPFAMAVR